MDKVYYKVVWKNNFGYFAYSVNREYAKGVTYHRNHGDGPYTCFATEGEAVEYIGRCIDEYITTLIFVKVNGKESEEKEVYSLNNNPDYNPCPGNTVYLDYFTII